MNCPHFRCLPRSVSSFYGKPRQKPFWCMPRPPYWWPPRFSRRIGLPIKVCGLPTCTAAKPTAHDNWYEYQYVRGGREIQSYWQNRVGIDVGEPSRAEYAFHLFAGHHGIFSLTPIWILSVIGVAIWLGQRDDRRLRELSLLIAAVTLVVVAFYIMRPQEDRNYGGMTTGCAGYSGSRRSGW